MNEEVAMLNTFQGWLMCRNLTTNVQDHLIFRWGKNILSVNLHSLKQKNNVSHTSHRADFTAFNVSAEALML